MFIVGEGGGRCKGKGKGRGEGEEGSVGGGEGSLKLTYILRKLSPEINYVCAILNLHPKMNVFIFFFKLRSISVSHPFPLSLTH